VGGRTNTWGRSCYRHGPMDFKTKSMQGFGEDWPISYEDLAPYYDKVERLVGIVGSKDNYINTPDGNYCGPAHRPRCTEVWFRDQAAKIGVPVVAERTADQRRVKLWPGVSVIFPFAERRRQRQRRKRLSSSSNTSMKLISGTPPSLGP